MTEVKVGQVYQCRNKEKMLCDRVILWADDRTVFFEHINETKDRNNCPVEYFLRYFELKKEKIKTTPFWIPILWAQGVSPFPDIYRKSYTKEGALSSYSGLSNVYKIIDAVEVKWEGEVP